MFLRRLNLWRLALWWRAVISDVAGPDKGFGLRAAFIMGRGANGWRPRGKGRVLRNVWENSPGGPTKWVELSAAIEVVGGQMGKQQRARWLKTRLGRFGGNTGGDSHKTPQEWGRKGWPTVVGPPLKLGTFGRFQSLWPKKRVFVSPPRG